MRLIGLGRQTTDDGRRERQVEGFKGLLFVVEYMALRPLPKALLP